MNIGNSYALHGKIETEALSVVMAQYEPISATSLDDVDKNVETVLGHMDRASCGYPGYDLFVTPEGGLQGYSHGGWINALVDIDGPQIQKLKDKCRELSVWGVFAPWVRPKSGNFAENMAIIINDEGEIVHRYVKMNPFIPSEPTHPGNQCPVTPGPKGSRLATIICSDGDYPEMWREAAFNGANIILRPAHYMAPWEQAWQITNKAGAYFNQCYVIACNGVGLTQSYSYFGNSMIVNPDGTTICEAPLGLTWLTKADLYPGIIDQMRKQAVHSNPLYTFQHRGASCPDFGGVGDTELPYRAYR